jgi:hypothetical protein
MALCYNASFRQLSLLILQDRGTRAARVPGSALVEATQASPLRQNDGIDRPSGSSKGSR